MEGRIFQLDCYLLDGDEPTPVSLAIDAPVREDRTGNFACLVHAEGLTERPARIVGPDRHHTRQLAEQFLRQLVKPMNLVDANGRPITLALG